MDSNLRDVRAIDYVRKRPFPIKRLPVPHEPAESKTKLILFQTHSKKICHDLRERLFEPHEVLVEIGVVAHVDDHHLEVGVALGQHQCDGAGD